MSSTPTEPRQGSYSSFKEQRASQVLLATATVKVTDSRGTQQPCRVLLDGGSQSSYITEDLAPLSANVFGLSRQRCFAGRCSFLCQVLQNASCISKPTDGKSLQPQSEASLSISQLWSRLCWTIRNMSR